MPDALDGCNEKLLRASHHLETLNCLIDEFRQKYRVRIDRYLGPNKVAANIRLEIKSGDELVWRVRIPRQPPLQWSAVIGDYLHDLRSALDHLAWQIAWWGPCPEPPPGTGFPIYPSYKRYSARRTDGSWDERSGEYMVRGFPPTARALIEKVQPYKCRKQPEHHPLWHLHELSNEDKHQSLHIAVAALADSHFEIKERRGIKKLKTPRPKIGPLKDQAEIGRLRVGVVEPGAYLHVQPHFTFGEAFTEKGPCARLPLWDTLDEIGGYVQREVFDARFAPYFYDA